MESKAQIITNLIENLCDTILRKADDIDFDGIVSYIERLTNEEISILNDYSKSENKQYIRSITQQKIFTYIEMFHDNTIGCAPFDFDSVGNYKSYVECFTQQYKKVNNSAPLPDVFMYVFSCIKEASEQYRLFERFYILRKKDVDEAISSIIKSAVDTASVAAEKAAKDAATQAASVAEKLADYSAQSAADAAKNAKEAASKEAKNAVEDAVFKKMNHVSTKITETSVTILGIFSGIVLTVVAGLFYSSTVLDNINSANFFRLLSISALVGFVCINLLTIMFVFIEKIGKRRGTLTKSFKATKWINVVLIIIMVFGIVLQFIFPSQEQKEVSDITNVNGRVSVNFVEDSKNDNDVESSTEKETEQKITSTPENS